MARQPLSLDALRERYGTAALDSSRFRDAGLDCGLPALERWLGPWARPGLIEIAGAPGSGRLALVLPALAALRRSGEAACVVDASGELHPGCVSGCADARVVWVRPGGMRAAWSAEQVARSGAVGAVLLVGMPRLGRAGLRLARAAEAGRCTVFSVVEGGDPALPATCRLLVEGWAGESGVRVHCVQHRRGRAGEQRVVALHAEESAAPRVLAFPRGGRA
jgi:hypothetical protein